jgi:hypothetical protein
MADDKQKTDYEFIEGRTLASFIRQNTETQTEVRVVESTMVAHGITKHFVKIAQRSIGADGKPGFEKPQLLEADLFEGILGKLKGVEYKAPTKPERPAKPAKAKAETPIVFEAQTPAKRELTGWDKVQADTQAKRAAGRAARADRRQLAELAERAAPETPPKAPSKTKAAPKTSKTPKVSHDAKKGASGARGKSAGKAEGTKNKKQAG